MRSMRPFLLLLLVVAGCDLWIFSTAPLLPDVLVTKWVNGHATNHMTRDEWLWSAVAMVTLVGGIVGAALVLLPPLLVGKVPFARVPRGQELQMLHRTEPARFLMAAAQVVWIAAFHWMILQANQKAEPDLTLAPILVWVGAQLASVVAFVVYMMFTTGQLRRA